MVPQVADFTADLHGQRHLLHLLPHLYPHTLISIPRREGDADPLFQKQSSVQQHVSMFWHWQKQVAGCRCSILDELCSIIVAFWLRVTR